MRFKNFQIWRGRLPHWRADDVTYYVTFRHGRPLEAGERQWLFHELMRPHGKHFDFKIVCVLPETTEAMFEVAPGPDGQPQELARHIEAAKRKAGKKVVKSTGERFPPFFAESYDRIVRDAAEFEERWMAILESPVRTEMAEDPEEYATLWVAGRDG